MTRIAIDTIVFDAGTQIRAAINEEVVSQYAEAMTDGAEFPPVVLFHDGSSYYMADGFHRALASKRIDARDIPADVRAGTKTDAIWFALGANKTNGLQLTPADKKHAIVLAVEAWPERSGKQIAEQIGCSQQWVAQVKTTLEAQDTSTCNLPDRVTGKDGKSYPASRRDRSARAERVVSPGSGRKLDAEARAQRLVSMQTMAGEGYTSRQIAARVGMSEEGCRNLLKEKGIDVPADRATRSTHRHNATRIVDQMVMDAEHLTADVNLIDFTTLDRTRLSEWLRSLSASRDKLGAFIRRLTKEQQNGEAA